MCFEKMIGRFSKKWRSCFTFLIQSIIIVNDFFFYFEAFVYLYFFLFFTIFMQSLSGHIGFTFSKQDIWARQKGRGQ